MRPAAWAAAVLALAAWLLPLQQAAASKKVFQPIIVGGEGEIELRGHTNRYKDRTTDAQYTLEFGYAPNDSWLTEIEFEWEKERGKDETEHTARAWENVFAWEQGQHWLDFGAFTEVEFGQTFAEPTYSFTAGPTFQKQFGHTLHTLNLFLHGEGGSKNADPNVTLMYAWQSRWLFDLAFQPGIEIFGEPGDITHFSPAAEQLLQAGPVIFGKFILPNRFAVKYELGVLYGQTSGTPSQTTKWMLEVERIF